MLEVHIISLSLDIITTASGASIHLYLVISCDTDHCDTFPKLRQASPARKPTLPYKLCGVLSPTDAAHLRYVI